MTGRLTWTPPTIDRRETVWAVYRDRRMVAVTMLGRDHAHELMELCRAWAPHIPAGRWSVEEVEL